MGGELCMLHFVSHSYTISFSFFLISSTDEVMIVGTVNQVHVPWETLLTIVL